MKNECQNKIKKAVDKMASEADQEYDQKEYTTFADLELELKNENNKKEIWLKMNQENIFLENGGYILQPEDMISDEELSETYEEPKPVE